MESTERNKLQKLAGIENEPAKPTHYLDYNGQRILKYSDGTFRVHDEEFKSTEDAARYIDHISR